jgi:hypothetical protein
MLRIRAVINCEILAFNKAQSPHCFEEHRHYCVTTRGPQINPDDRAAPLVAAPAQRTAM